MRQRLWCPVRLPGLCLVFTLLIGVCAGLGSAQQQQPKPHPSTVARLILLPTQVVASAPAMLAVLDSQGRLLTGIRVELSTGQKITTDDTGRALFRGPERAGTLVAKIIGQGVTAAAAVIASGRSGPASSGTNASPPAINVASYPHVVALHDRFTLEGSGFQGIADSNHVSLNGDPCLIVASSPVSLVVLPGAHSPLGDVTLRVAVGGMVAGQFPISTVLLEFSGPAEAVNAGSSGKLLLHAHGTIQPLLVEVSNNSPAVIQLTKGDVQRVMTSGGEENVASVDVKFLSGGNYEVSARLIPADASAPREESTQKPQKN